MVTANVLSPEGRALVADVVARTRAVVAEVLGSSPSGPLRRCAADVEAAAARVERSRDAEQLDGHLKTLQVRTLEMASWCQRIPDGDVARRLAWVAARAAGVVLPPATAGVVGEWFGRLAGDESSPPPQSGNDG